MGHVRHFLFVLVLCAVVSCSKSGSEGEGEEKNSRKADPKYQMLAEKFAQTFIDRDYGSGYDLMSPAFREQVSYGDFEDGVRVYRDAFEGEVTASYIASDDPQDMADFVAETERQYLVEEITIEFTGRIEGEESSIFCTVWVIDGGTPQIGRFYLED